MKEIWTENFEKLLNEQFDWDRDNLESCPVTEGECEEPITEEKLHEAMSKMKKWKSSGPSKVTVE